MALSVDIRGLDDEAEDLLYGRLVFSGHGSIVIEPADDDSVALLEGILEEPIVLFAPDRPEGWTVAAEEEPEAFLRGLHQHYKSSYLRATQVVEQ